MGNLPGIWPHSYKSFSRDLITKAKQSEKSPDYIRDYTYVPADAVRDFCEKNQRRQPVWRELGTKLPIKLLAKQESREFFKHQPGEKPDGWDRFYAEHPGALGIITVSRVGFNHQRDTAVVYLGIQRHWLNGHGGLQILRKKNGKWDPQPIFFGPMWVS